MGMREKILLGIAVFALAGIMVPMTADAAHDENHKSVILVGDQCLVAISTCAMYFDINNDGLCQTDELASGEMPKGAAVRLINLGFFGFCAS